MKAKTDIRTNTSPGKSKKQKAQATRNPDRTRRSLKNDQPAELPIAHILERVSDGFVALDAQMNYTYVNKMGGEILGRDPQDLIGRNYWKEYPEAKGTPFAEAYVRALQTQIPIIFEDYYEPFDRWFENRIYPSPDGLAIFFTDTTGRKQAEEELHKNENRFRALIENGRDNISLIALDGTLLWESPSSTSTLGYAPNHLVGRNMFELVHPDDQDWTRELYAQLIQTPGKSQDGTFRLRHADGTWRWIEATVSNMQNVPAVNAMVINYRDISDRKRAEEALQDSEIFTRTVLDNLPVGIAVNSVDPAVFNYMNDNFVRLYRTTREKISDPDVFWEAVYEEPDFREEIKKRVLADSASGDPERMVWVDVPITRKGEETRFISARNVPIPGKSLVVSMVWDVTERTRAEQAVRESEGLYRQAIEVAGGVPYREIYSPEGILVDYQFIGEGIRQITGYGPEEFNAAVWDSLVQEIHPVEELSGYSLDDAIQKVRSGEIPIWKCDFKIRTRDGEIRWVFEAAVELRNEHGISYGSIGIYQDITERKRVQEELARQVEYVSTLNTLGQEINSSLDLGSIYHSSHRAASRLMPGETFVISILHEADQEIEDVYLWDTDRLWERERYPVGQDLPDYIIRNGRPLCVNDWGESHDKMTGATDFGYMQNAIRSLLAVPLFRTGGKCFGMMSIQSSSPNLYTPEHEQLLVMLAQQVARAIENAQLYDEVQNELVERKHAEDALIEGERLLKESQIVAGLGNYVLDIPNGLWKSSEVLDDVFGIDETFDRSAEGWAALIHPDHREQMVDYFTNEVIGKRVRFDKEYKIIRNNDKAERWVYGQGELEMDANDQPVKMVGTIQDITGRKRAEEQINRRVAELEALYQSGIGFSQTLDPRDIAEKVIEVLMGRLNWHHAAVRVRRENSDEVELLAFSRSDEPHGNKTWVQSIITQVGQGMAGWVIEHGQVVRSGEVTEDPRYLETFPGMKSGLYIPMKTFVRTIGCISVESDQPNAFTEDDERLMVTLAVQASVAIENARLYGSALLAAQRRGVLYQAGQGMVRIRQDLEQVYAAVHHSVSQLMPTEAFAIVMLDEPKNEVEAVYLYDKGGRWPVQRVPLGEGFSSRVISSGKTLLIVDLEKTPLEAVHYGTEEQIRSVLAVPMRVGSKVTGVISAQSYRPNAYTVDDQRLLEMLAAQVSIAIENARLFDQTEARAKEFASLFAVATDLASRNDLTSVLNMIAKHMAALLNATGGAIYLYQAEQNELEVVAVTHDSIRVGTRLKPGEGMAGRVAESRQPMIVEDYQTWEGRSPQYSQHRFGAILEVPMIYSGELVGVLVAFHLHPTDPSTPDDRKFTENDLRLLSLFASHAAGAVYSARFFDDAQRRLHHTQVLHEIDLAIAGSMDVKLILQIVLRHVLSELRVDAATILLYHPLERVLRYESGSGFRTTALQFTDLRLGDGYAGRVALGQQTVHIPDLQIRHTDFLRSPAFSREGFVCYFGVPLIAKGEIKGVLEIFHRSSLRPDAEWLEFMETLAGQIAIAIDNATLYKDLQHSNIELALAYDATIEGWSNALDLRDKETEGHTQRVTSMSLDLARAMGIPESEMIHIRRGGLLHDIGKMGVPDQILLKPDKLTDEEWVTMRQHPVHAYNLLKHIEFLAPAMDIPHYHHEKWDGSGYPEGLQGEEIPLHARIFAVVDVWDALRSDRPYRSSWSADRTRAYILEQSGKYFDPKVVDIFLGLIGDE
jgi:PAS domain S-box-containing protein